MHKIWLRWLLIFILSLAFLVRVFNLSSNPPELFSDEITHVLSARTIIQTGHDINGALNLYLYNRLKLGAPIYGYLAAFSTFIFGDNNFTVRLPAALAGTLTVYLICQLIFMITKSKGVSLLGGFVAAITPWNIYFSRIAWEPSLILPFILSGILSFYKGVNSKNILKVILPYIIFGVAVYGADALEFLSPVFLFILMLLNFKIIWKNKYKHILGLGLFAIILIPYVLVVTNNPLKYGRSIRISTFATGINTENIKVFAKNYLAHVSPVFLFENGDPNLRQGTGTDGVLYWAILPFVLIGIFYSIANFKKPYYLFVLIWLLIFPLGGSLTNDGVPHATRTLIGDPVFILLFAIGFLFCMKFIKINFYRVLFVSFFVAVLIFEFFNFSNNYFVIYPARASGLWDYGEKETFDTIKSVSKGNETLCLTNIEYWHQDTYTNYYLGINNKYKIIFNINDPACLSSDIIVVSTEVSIPSKYGLIKYVYDLYGKPILGIYKLLK